MDQHKQAPKEVEVEAEGCCEGCKALIYILDDDGYKCSCTDEYYCQICYMGDQGHMEHNSYESDDDGSD